MHCLSLSTSVALIATLLTTSCSTTHSERQAVDTPECQQYRSMSSAPMAPDAVERLHIACEASLKK